MLYPQSTVYLNIGLVIVEPMLCQRIVFVEILLTHHISHEVVPPVGRGQPVNSPVANNVSTVSTPLTTVDHRSTPHVNKQHLKSLTLHKHICPHKHDKGLGFPINDLLCI